MNQNLFLKKLTLMLTRLMQQLHYSQGKAQAGYGMMLLLVFLASTVLIGTSIQLVLGSTAGGYLGTSSQDWQAANGMAQNAIETVIADIQNQINLGTTITTSYSYSGTNTVSMPTDSASLGGGTTQIGSFTGAVTYARGNAYVVKVTATVGSATTSLSRLVYINRITKLLDSMVAPNAAYSLRKVRSGYNGSALRVRRASDNTEQDIGFDGNGNLDVAGLKSFLSANTLPVDSVGSAGVAFGLRKLRAAYTGYAIKVRRSSDSSVQDIGFTSSGELDTGALLNFVGSDTGYVTTWYDQSGNAVNATQATNAAQPTIVVNGQLNLVNNKPAILYDGTDDQLLFTRTVSDDFTIMACYSVIAGDNPASGYPNWYDHSAIVDGEVAGLTNDFGISVDSAGSIYVGVGNPDTTILSPTAGYNDGRMHWVAMDRTKSTGYFTLYHDTFSYSGPDANTPNTASLTAPSQLSIGRVVNSHALNGYVNEVLIYSSVLSGNNRRLLQRNEGWYYSMTPVYSSWTKPLNAISSIPTNTLAYSLRSLNTGYTYNAIRVRRSSDNTEQNIGWDTYGNLDVASLLAFVGNGSGYVVTFYDQSGTGKNLGQSTPSLQPRIVNAGVLDTVNGKPAIYFNGTTFLENTGLTTNTSTKVTGLVYASQPSSGQYSRLISLFANGRWDYDNNDSVSLVQTSGSNTLQFERNNGGSTRPTTVDTFEYGTPFLGTSIFDGTNAYLYIDGAKGVSYPFTAAFNYSNIRLGNSPQNSANDHFVGYMAEVYVFPTAMSSNDRLILQQNILSYYAPPPVMAYVTKWYDQSGNGNHLSQTNPNLQPTIAMPAYGSFTAWPTVRFSGSQYLYSTTGMPISSDYSKVAVFSYFDSTKENHVISGNANNSHAFYMSSTNYLRLFQYGAPGFVISNLAMSTKTNYAVSATYTEVSPGRTGIVYVGNASRGTGSTGHSNGSDTSLSLGAYNSGNSTLYGTVSEAMVFARSLSAVDRTAIYNDERAYFGTQ